MAGGLSCETLHGICIKVSLSPPPPPQKRPRRSGAQTLLALVVGLVLVGCPTLETSLSIPSVRCGGI